MLEFVPDKVSFGLYEPLNVVLEGVDGLHLNLPNHLTAHQS